MDKRNNRNRKRGAGILLPVTSLPSPWGIGTLGKAAFEFLDFLKAAGQQYWQVLPLGPSVCGNSPYSSCSSRAGNPLLIDLDFLYGDGLLRKEEIEACDFGSDPEQADYEKLNKSRLPLLRKAFERGRVRCGTEIAAFTEENREWLLPYVRFMALRKANGGIPWNQWTAGTQNAGETEDRNRPEETYGNKNASEGEPEEELREEENFQVFLQYLFFRQWDSLRAYAKELGIRIIGDVPVYVPYDSADCWSEPEQFQLAENNEPAFVSGVPPDYFSEDGQLWGNPLYNYDRMKADGFNWWIRRIGGAAGMFDVLRIDHFRGFASYYSIPAGEETARNGMWKKGPGMDLAGVLTSWFSETEFIAEDLGTLTEDVKELLESSGLPGMKVLQFAFDGDSSNSHLPHRHREDAVCYTGTHDNPTLKEWTEEADPGVIAFARNYLGISAKADLSAALLREAYKSTAYLTVVPMQDWLGLGREGRMNVPGVPEGNWGWRMRDGVLTKKLADRIRAYTETYGRL